MREADVLADWMRDDRRRFEGGGRKACKLRKSAFDPTRPSSARADMSSREALGERIRGVAAAPRGAGRTGRCIKYLLRIASHVLRCDMGSLHRKSLNISSLRHVARWER